MAMKKNTKTANIAVAGALSELRSKHKIEGKEELPKEKLS